MFKKILILLIIVICLFTFNVNADNRHIITSGEGDVSIVDSSNYLYYLYYQHPELFNNHTYFTAFYSRTNEQYYVYFTNEEIRKKDWNLYRENSNSVCTMVSLNSNFDINMFPGSCMTSISFSELKTNYDLKDYRTLEVYQSSNISLATLEEYFIISKVCSTQLYNEWSRRSDLNINLDIVDFCNDTWHIYDEKGNLHWEPLFNVSNNTLGEIGGFTDRDNDSASMYWVLNINEDFINALLPANFYQDLYLTYKTNNINFTNIDDVSHNFYISYIGNLESGYSLNKAFFEGLNSLTDKASLYTRELQQMHASFSEVTCNTSLDYSYTCTAHFRFNPNSLHGNTFFVIKSAFPVESNEPGFKIISLSEEKYFAPEGESWDKTYQDYLDTQEGLNDPSFFKSFFDDFSSPDHKGISGIVTSPLVAINSMLDNTCTPMTTTFRGKEITFQCGDMFWSREGASDIKDFLNLLEGGILSYMIIRKLFKLIESLKDPDDDKVEVMKL